MPVVPAFHPHTYIKDGNWWIGNTDLKVQAEGKDGNSTNGTDGLTPYIKDVMLQINGIKNMLAGNGITLEMTDEAVRFIASTGYDPEFGARPVKRAIQRYLLNDLSKKLLSQEVDRSKPIIVETAGDGLKFRN